MKILIGFTIFSFWLLIIAPLLYSPPIIQSPYCIVSLLYSLPIALRLFIRQQFGIAGANALTLGGSLERDALVHICY